LWCLLVCFDKGEVNNWAVIKQLACYCNTLQGMRQWMRSVWFEQDVVAYVTRQNVTFLRGKLTSQFGDFIDHHIHWIWNPKTFCYGSVWSVKCILQAATKNWKSELQGGNVMNSDDLLQLIMQNFKWLQQCTTCHGGQLEQVIFKKWGMGSKLQSLC
jgi:hypothetical protein